MQSQEAIRQGKDPPKLIHNGAVKQLLVLMDRWHRLTTFWCPVSPLLFACLHLASDLKRFTWYVVTFLRCLFRGARFAMIDRNNSGVIEKEDFWIFMRCAGQVWEDARLEEMFAIFHEKYRELKARRQTRLEEWQGGPDCVLWFFVMSDHRVRKERELIEAKLAELSDLFGLIDLDGSGGLDKEELAVVLRSLGQKPSDEELEEMLATNVDGDPEGEKELDFSEFLKLMTAPDSRAARRLLVQIQEFRVSYTLLTGGGLQGSGDEGKEGPKEEGPKEERPVEADVEMIRAALVLLGDWCGNCGYSRVCDCGADPTQYTAEETPSTRPQPRP